MADLGESGRVVADGGLGQRQRGLHGRACGAQSLKVRLIGLRCHDMTIRLHGRSRKTQIQTTRNTHQIEYDVSENKMGAYHEIVEVGDGGELIIQRLLLVGDLSQERHELDKLLHGRRNTERIIK